MACAWFADNLLRALFEVITKTFQSELREQVLRGYLSKLERITLVLPG